MILLFTLGFTLATLALSAHWARLETLADNEIRSAIVATAFERKKLGRTHKLQSWN